jgi:hypothetical protein
MAENDKPTEDANGESIDYDAKQADVDRAKQKARDQDAERLAKEHE